MYRQTIPEIVSVPAGSMILPPHCSPILQQLDVGAIAPLERALSPKTDVALSLDLGRISRVG